MTASLRPERNKAAIIDFQITEKSTRKLRIDSVKTNVGIGVCNQNDITSQNLIIHTYSGISFKKNDIVSIKVEVDAMKKAPVQFFHGNSNLGILFKGLDIPLYLYMVFTSRNDKVTIIDEEHYHYINQRKQEEKKHRTTSYDLLNRKRRN